MAVQATLAWEGKGRRPRAQRGPVAGASTQFSRSPSIGVFVIKSPGSSLEYPRYSQEYLNHATFAPPRGGRLGGAGWLPRRIRTDGRVKLSGKKVVRAGYEPCTSEQQALFEDHSQFTAHVRPMAPASSRWPIWPAIDHARLCKCHGIITHVTAAAVGVC